MESSLLIAIKNGDKSAFDQVFLQYFRPLHAYVFNMVNDGDEAEEIVQNTFVKIWTKRDQLKPDGFLKAFLYRSAHNEALNFLKRQKVRLNFSNHVNEETGNLNEEIMATELERHMNTAIDSLPEKCRVVFQLSRFDQMKYQEIALTLNISIKTVENQLGKALKLLRTKMADFLILAVLLFKW